jgi:hypothetical protein
VGQFWTPMVGQFSMPIDISFTSGATSVIRRGFCFEKKINTPAITKMMKKQSIASSSK